MGFLDRVLREIAPRLAQQGGWGYRTPPFVSDAGMQEEANRLVGYNTGTIIDPTPRSEFNDEWVRRREREGIRMPIKLPVDEQTAPIEELPPVPSSFVPPVSVDTGGGDDKPYYPLNTESLEEMRRVIGDIQPKPREPQTDVPPVKPMLPEVQPNIATETTLTSQQPQRQYRRYLDEAIAERRRLEEMNPRDLDQNKDSWTKNFGKSIAMNLPMLQAILANPNMNDRQALLASVGTLAGSAATATFAPYADEYQQLQYKKAMADKQIADAQGQYDKDVMSRYNEKRIEDIDINNQIEMTKRAQEDAKIRGKLYGYQTARLESLRKLFKEGTASADANKELVSVMGDIVGAPVTISNFNPQTDKIKDVKVVQDAQNNKAYVVTVTTGGKVREEVVRDEQGNVAYVKDPRVKAEEIRSQTSITTTGMRTKSQEQIAQWRIKSTEALTREGYTLKEIDQINDEVYNRWVNTDEDEIIDAYAKSKGVSSDSYTPEQREAILDAYWDGVRDKVKKERNPNLK